MVSGSRIVEALAMIAVLGVVAYSFFPGLLEGETELYTTRLLDVPVSSTTPFSSLPENKNLALRTTDDPAAITCNFELAAISNAERRGIIVTVERGAQELFIGEREVYIRGSTDDEILASCHAYACLLRGISCPDDLLSARTIIWQADNLSLVADANLSAAGTRGYAELLGLFGYVQSSRLDRNGDGVIDSFEKKRAAVAIRPYLAQDGECTLQEIRNIYQAANATNETVSCGIAPAIHLIESDEDRIVVEDDGRILLYGSGQNLFSEAVIVRDVIAPSYIRAVYGMR